MLNPMQHFLLLRDVLQELYHVELRLLNSQEAIVAFCDRHRFHPLQKQFTPAGMQEILEKTTDATILHSIDALHVHLMMFRVENTPIAMGPFCPLLFSKHDAQIILEENGLTAVPTQDFLAYVSTNPFLPEKGAWHIVHAVLHSLYPQEADDRREILLEPPTTASAKIQTDPTSARANYALLLEKRYSYEQKFRKSIMEGNQRAALLNLAKMEQDVSYLKRIGSTMENEKTGAAITRTVARLAAMEGGLPGIMADQISSQNTQTILRARTIDEILQAKEKMVRAYCAAVREAKTNPYSVLVQSVLYAVEQNYSKDISLTELAAELAISKNYLIKRFKAEVGVTPIQYLTEYRLKQATALLEEHDSTIQDIAVAVGIPDANYFTKLFRKFYHVSPQQYRKMKIV